MFKDEIAKSKFFYPDKCTYLCLLIHSITKECEIDLGLGVGVVYGMTIHLEKLFAWNRKQKSMYCFLLVRIISNFTQRGGTIVYVS